MNTWNYRVIQRVGLDGTPHLQIHEVYYEGDRPVAYTESAAEVMGETLEELIQCLGLMRACLDQPVLVERDFGREG